MFTLDELVERRHRHRRRRAGCCGRSSQRRLAFLVSGGTGSGKTTLLAALLSLVDPSERLVLVEDASELRPDHPHVVGLEARPANVEGAGEVTLRTLVRQALRMRPDRLVVGEVRGAEVVDLLAAMNTGHEGGCGTLHANSAADVPARIEALALAAGLPRAAAHSQLRLGRRRGGPPRPRARRSPPGRARSASWRRSTGSPRVAPAVAFDDGEVHTHPAADALLERLDLMVVLAALAAPRSACRSSRSPPGHPAAARQRLARPQPAARPCWSSRWRCCRCSCSRARQLVLGLVGVLVVAAGQRLLARRRAAAGAADRAARVQAFCESVAAELAAGQPPHRVLARAVAEWPEFTAAAVGGRARRRRARRPAPAGAAPGAGELQAGRRRVAGRAPHRSGAGRRARAGRPGRPGAPSHRPAGRRRAGACPRDGADDGVPAAGVRRWPGPAWAVTRWAFLIGTTPGLACLSGGLALSYAGLEWLQRIADAVLRG